MLIYKTYKHLLKLLKQLACHVEKNKYKMYQQELHHRHHHHHSTLTVLGVMSVMLLPALLLPLKCVGAVGYSYTRFTGPVTGPEHKVYVNDVTHRNPYYKGSVSTRLDYVAKPEYEFAYGVEDADAHVLHNRNEMRDGDAVKGVYSLIDPDGALRVVKYTADETNGFQAEVIRNGISSLHGQLKNENEFAEQNPKLIRNNNKYYSKDDRDEQHHYTATPSSSLHSLPKWDQQPQKYPQPSLLSQYNPIKQEKWSSTSAQFNRPKIEQQQHLPQPLSAAHYNRPKVEKWPSSAQYNAPSVSTQYNPLKFKQWQQVSSHQRPYNHQFKQQTPSTTTIRNYNDYNKININDNGTDNGNDASDDEADEQEEQPHYEVHEKPNHDNDYDDHDDNDHESEQEKDDKEDDEDVGDYEKYQKQPQHHSQLPSSLLQYNPVKWEQHYSQSPPSSSSLYKPSILVQPQYKPPQYNPPKLQQWQQVHQQPPYNQYNHYQQQTTPAPLITYSDYNLNNYNKNNTDDQYNADDKANTDDADEGPTGQYANDNDVDVDDDVSEEPQSQTEVSKPGKEIVVILTNKKKKKPFSNKKNGNKDGNDEDDDDDYDDDDDSSDDDDDDDDDSDEFEEYDEAVRKPNGAEYF